MLRELPDCFYHDDEMKVPAHAVTGMQPPVPDPFPPPPPPPTPGDENPSD